MRVKLVTPLAALTFTRESITKQRGSPVWGFCKDLSSLTPSRAAEQAVPAPHHLHHRISSSKDQDEPPCAGEGREGISFLSLPATHLSPLSPHHPPLSGPYPKHSVVSRLSTILLLLQTHSQTTTAVDSVNTFVP